jgi:hypothetical protein
LDSALSMHARQLTQRQAREAELERTIADLGAALVVARNKELERLKSTQDAGASSDSRDAGSFSAKFAAAEEELETIRAQLSIERERVRTNNCYIAGWPSRPCLLCSDLHLIYPRPSLRHKRCTRSLGISTKNGQKRFRHFTPDSYRVTAVYLTWH